MKPLTIDDLIPLSEYAARRREFFDTLSKYLDRYRRVRVGPKVTLLFENRQTLWFKVHEIIRIARLSDATRLQRELNYFNQLLPSVAHLQAAMLIEVENESKLLEELKPWQYFNGADLRLCIGKIQVLSDLITCRSEDLQIGTAHWLQFRLDHSARQHLADFQQIATLECTLPDYQHCSAPLSDEIRQSLLEDLELSDRDAA